MTTTANDFLMSGGTVSAKFPTPGTVVSGTIVREPEVQQQRDFTTGEPKFWDDGKPMQQLQVTLATSERDPANPDDSGERALYVKGQMQRAVREAVRKAGASGINVGGTLTVTYTGNGEAKRGLPPKLYSAVYAPPSPAADFLNGPGEGEAAPAAPAQPAAPGTPGLTPEQLAAIAALSPEEKARMGL